MRRLVVLIAVLALVSAGCGDGGGTGASGDGEERTVLVDYKHDEFSAAFLRYYPETVKVRPGDSVRFKQTWTGEAHSVTAGLLVNDLFEFAPLFEKYHSPEEALAGGVSQETLDRVIAAFSKIPGMTAHGEGIYQPGAQPCYVEDAAAVPAFATPDDEVIMDAQCPTKGKAQPAFNGRQALYNSGFIPYQGNKGNTFELPIAEDAAPGTYKYFCNYHFTEMQGTIEIVAEDASIPSQEAVGRQARKEIEQDAKAPLAQVVKAQKASFTVGDGVKPPLAGLDNGSDEPYSVLINEFFPANVNAKVGRPVTWTDQGAVHTVSFNVPKYFPIFTVAKNGEVRWDERSYEPVAWKVPERPEPPPDSDPEAPNPIKIDVGEWDGGGGFHSSGALEPGDTFTVTFTKPGTYLYACVLHPPMVGKVVVKA